MPIEVFGTLLGVLFLALCYLHYRHIQHEKYVSRVVKELDTAALTTYVMLIGLTEVLFNKKVVTEEDMKDPEVMKFPPSTTTSK